MALSITRLREAEVTKPYTSDKRLYVTADRSRLVAEGDPAAAFLLVGAGGEIPEAEARRYGLLAEPESAPEKAKPKAHDKARHGPPENKGR